MKVQELEVFHIDIQMNNNKNYFKKIINSFQK